MIVRGISMVVIPDVSLVTTGCCVAEYRMPVRRVARYDGSYSGSPRLGSCSTFTGSANVFSSSYKVRDLCKRPVKVDVTMTIKPILDLLTPVLGGTGAVWSMSYFEGLLISLTHLDHCL